MTLEAPWQSALITSKVRSIERGRGTVLGKIFVFEGIDGCGKSTQIHLTSALLSARGIPHSVIEFPGSSHFATEVKAVLERFSSGNLPATSEAFMHLAVMLNSFANLVKPALDSNNHILLDRFFISTAAYQGAHNSDIAQRIISTAIPWFDMDIISNIFLLDISPEVAKKRIALRGDKNDRYDDLPIDEKVLIRSRYREALDMFGAKSSIIDADRKITEISDEIFSTIEMQIGI